MIEERKKRKREKWGELSFNTPKGASFGNYMTHIHTILRRGKEKRRE